MSAAAVHWSSRVLQHSRHHSCPCWLSSKAIHYVMIQGSEVRVIISIEEAFRHIDLEKPLQMIKLAREAGVKHCNLLTSANSKANSWFLYIRMKGEVCV